MHAHHLEGLTAAQQAVQEQMRRSLEEDQYSAVGSIVDTESDEEDHTLYSYRGIPVRLDKAALQQAVRKNNLLERLSGAAVSASATTTTATLNEDEDDDEDDEEPDVNSSMGRRSGGGGGHNSSAANKAKKKKNRKDEVSQLQEDTGRSATVSTSKDPLSLDAVDDDLDRDGGSIFGATVGSSNSTWVECDKCKKWRRLRGVVDEKKLPSKWYCSMNKNDPERARCSAPEEEYDTQHTPESAADARTRKHMRVWVRRLLCNEAFEGRQPTLTRGKKRAVASSSKDPYEWVRCCNPSCGKWRAVLRMMDAKTSVLDRALDGEWYCVMNNWDEKTASCAAPQENLPAVGCPPWVMQDER